MPGKPLAVLNHNFLISSEGNNEIKQAQLQAVASNLKLPVALRDLAKLYEVYIFESDFDRKMDQLNALSGPDRPYRVLAIEAKVDLLIGNNAFEDALIEIDQIETALSPSSQITARIKSLKKIIQDKIISK